MELSDTVDQIRLHWRLSKAAERARIAIDHGLVSFARVHLTSWRPDMDAKERKAAADQAKRVVMSMLDGKMDAILEDDKPIVAVIGDMVLGMCEPRATFVDKDNANQKAAIKLAKSLPAWERIGHVKGFSPWGLATLIACAGYDPGKGVSIGAFSGVRKLYKRLGLAPDECYPTGEKKQGRKIPRNTRGSIMGIIADALLRAQWRGEKEDVPAHPIGPYGAVYGEAKARHLAAGKRPAHADKSARRAMVKALIHDVWCAWHDRPLRYANEPGEVSHSPAWHLTATRQYAIE